MADKIPLKAIFSGSDVVAESEFDPTDTVGVAFGGLSKTSIAADQILYSSAADTYTETPISAFGRSLIDDADAATARTTLGLGTAAVKNTGTSGDTVPLNNTSNVYSQIQDFSAAGVYLGAAAASNLLDDYEEGTFTPVVADAASGGNEATATTATGIYRKIGSFCSINIFLNNVDTTGLTGANNLHITGLPFVSDVITGHRHTGKTEYGGVTLTANSVDISADVISNGSVMRLRESYNNGSAISTITISQLSSGSAIFYISLGYVTQ